MIPDNNLVKTDEAESQHPASVVSRTFKGLLLTGIVIGLFLLDHYAAADWLPESMQHSGGVGELIVNGLFLIIPLIFLVTIALAEFRSLAAGIGTNPPLLLMIPPAIILLLASWVGLAVQYGGYKTAPLFLHDFGLNAIIIICFSTMLCFAFYAVSGKIANRTLDVAAYGFGLIYIALPFIFLIAIRIRWGVPGLFLALAVCKFTDIGAYYFGKMIGGPKMAPVVSPNKTWAGALGGIFAAILASVLLNMLFIDFWGLVPAVLFGILIAAIAILGDLAESFFKREADIKDSGQLIRGYGGVLDMIDDVLFVAPAAYIFMSIAGSI